MSVDAVARKSVAKVPPLVLRFVRGTHRGAERACRDRDIVLIGSAEDCDMVLMGDPGVAAHHCMVTITGGMLHVRAMDAAIEVDGEIIEPGEPRLIQAFQRIALGQAVCAFGPSWGKEWEALDHVDAFLHVAMERSRHESPASVALSAPADAAEMLPASSKRSFALMAALGVGAFAAAIAMVVAAWPERQNQQLSLKAQVALVRETLRSSDQAELRAVIDNQKIVIDGIARSSKSVQELQRKLQLNGIPVVLNARVADQISEQVRELLKVGGVNAQTEYAGASTVRVTGSFDDGVALSKALSQPAMQDIAPGLKLEVVNLKAATEQALPIAATKAVLADLKDARGVCNATECFVRFAATGNIFFVGSTLPSGAELTKVTVESANVEIEGLQFEVNLERNEIGPIPPLLVPQQ
jgi:Inner membrane component of T3SS, cytoplasmic domain